MCISIGAVRSRNDWEGGFSNPPFVDPEGGFSNPPFGDSEGGFSNPPFNDCFKVSCIMRERIPCIVCIAQR